MTVWTGRWGTSRRKVTVTTPDGCPTGELRSGRVAALLGDALGMPGDALCVRGRLLDESSVLGETPLLDGVSVRLVKRSDWSPQRTSAALAATEIAVIGGPDAGRTRPLTAGAHTVGRSGADLTLADPSLSRRHLRLDVGPGGVRARDLGSENGTRLDGQPLPGDGDGPLALGAVLELGHSTMTVRPTTERPDPTTARGDGTVLVHRSPRAPEEPPTASVTVPPAPEPPAARRIPWPAVLIPLPVAGVLAALFGPHLLLLAVMSPLMLLGSHVSDRLGARASHARAVADHEEQRHVCAQRRDEALEVERLWRERTHPDLALLARAASTPSGLLWSRPAAGALTVRLGTGTVESAVTWVEQGRAELRPLPGAPVSLDLSTYAPLTVGGPLAGRVVDALLGQLLVLHSPRDVAVWTDRGAWTLAPHVRIAPVAALVADAGAIVQRRADRTDRAGHDTEPTRPVIVLAVSDDDLRGDDVGLLDLVRRAGTETGVCLVRVVTASAPSDGGAHLETLAAGRAVLTGPGHPPVTITVDAVGADWVTRVASALAPLRDQGADRGSLADEVALGDALRAAGIEPTPDGIAQRWSRADDGARMTLGVTVAGPYTLDLAAAGPHALIGGTTGSGKSELLRTVVTSLAAAHPPEDLAVVLVDYKGGSAFAGLEELPHIVGVVTDLDPFLTARALTSLRAEIRRREGLFARCGARDILDYRARTRRQGASLPHLARLVIVVDEFRALADELPEFVSGLVRIAAVGRSLGIHLVLATQRPAGVVTADMRANLGLRIALRVRDRADSQDVLASDEAALLPAGLPGRGLLRSGTEAVVAFQTAVVTPPRAAAGLRLEIAWSDGTTTTRLYPVSHPPPAPGLVEAIVSATRRSSRRAPPSPWLAPLPASVSWDAILPAAAWAVRDDLDRQRQDPVCVDVPSLEHVAVAGAIGSGRSTTLLSLATAALAGNGAHTHLYLVAEPTGALGPLAALPHTGALVDRAAPALVAGFVERLSAEVRARRSTPATTTATTTVLVVIDGWDVLADACDALDHGALTDRLLATLREGYAVGVRAVISGDRTVLTGRVGRTLTERLLLRPADPADLILAGLPHTAAPTQWPPGRAVRAGDRAELQVLLREPDAHRTTAPLLPPWRLLPLPDRVDASALTAGPVGTLAVALTTESPLPLTVGQPGRRRIVVVGSAGAGRTGTLALLAAQAVGAGRRVCVVDDPHGGLGHALLLAGQDVDVLNWEDRAELVALRRGHPDLVVLADDVDRHADSLLVPVLTEVADLAERDGGLIAVAGDGAALVMRSRGIGAVVARGRTGFVLGAPSPLDDDLLGVRLPRVRETIPGRGWFVADRRASAVQVAAVDLAQSRPSTPLPRDPSTPRRRP